LFWTELDDSLGGEVHFVGSNASVSLTASEYFRGEADTRADYIYFADDNFHVATAVRGGSCRAATSEGALTVQDRFVKYSSTCRRRTAASLAAHVTLRFRMIGNRDLASTIVTLPLHASLKL
jgi:hypothetical protein